MTDWAAGEYCQLHEMMYCTDCAAKAGIRRTHDGEVRYDSDCAVSSFQELLGCDQDTALTALTAVGFNPRKGTAEDGVVSALRAAGLKVVPTSARIEDLPFQSFTRPVAYFVAGYKGRKGHAWTVTNGKANRAYSAPFKYRAYAVTTA